MINVISLCALDKFLSVERKGKGKRNNEIENVSTKTPGGGIRGQLLFAEIPFPTWMEHEG